MSTIKTIQQTFEPLFAVGLTPLIIGPHGLGKSSIVRQYAKKQGIGFVDLRLGTQDVGDLIGLAEFEKDPLTGQSIATKFVKPDWFPTEGKGIIFLDEMNRAPKYVLQAIFQLLLERQLHRHKLPEGWNIVAAGNPPSGDYTVTDMSDKAFLDRFCILKMENSVVDFLEYAKESNFNSNVMEYINLHNEMLATKTEDFNLDDLVKPSNRTWEFVSRLENLEMNEDIRRTILRGMIGFNGMVHYLDFKEKNQLNITEDQILSSYSKVKKIVLKLTNDDNPRIDQLSTLVDKLSEKCSEKKLTTKQVDNVAAFLIDIPKDLSMKLLKILSSTSTNVDSITITAVRNYNFIAISASQSGKELIKQITELGTDEKAKTK